VRALGLRLLEPLPIAEELAALDGGIGGQTVDAARLRGVLAQHLQLHLFPLAQGSAVEAHLIGPVPAQPFQLLGLSANRGFAHLGGFCVEGYRAIQWLCLALLKVLVRGWQAVLASALRSMLAA